MERFSGRFREKYPHTDHLDNIENLYDSLVRLRREYIYSPDVFPELHDSGKVPRNPINVLVLAQTAIRRGLELTDATIRDANAFSYTPVWVNSRSLFELGSLVFDMADKVNELVAAWDLARYTEFDTHLSKIMLGFKSAVWHPGREKGEHLDLVPQNIITVIRRIEKKHIPEFFSLYELLSEVAHPNYMGMMEQYQKLHHEDHVAEFIDRPAERDITSIQIPLDNADGSLALLVRGIESYEANLGPYALACAKGIPPDAPDAAI
jgi:hypothetical protein